MDHTHLVKGLDFALLAKIKSENTQKEKEDREKAMRGVEEQQAKVQKYVDRVVEVRRGEKGRGGRK